MTQKQLKELKNFSVGEKDIYGRKIFNMMGAIDPMLMERIDYAVTLGKGLFSNTFFVVHDINQGEHSKGSLHYEGKAIDGHFAHLPLERQWFLCMLAGFKGIGIYPEHKTPDIHADIRDQDVVSVWRGYYTLHINKDGKEEIVQDYEYDRLDFMELLGI